MLYTTNLMKILFADDIKKEYIDINEEEVTTSSVESSSNNDYIDYLVWNRTSPTEGSLPGLDLSDPRQLADFARLVPL